MESVDVLVIGAGITGVYQLYRSLEAGFSAKLVEAGSGVGGVWYWNRYPEARLDSESYTYGYLFSEELYQDWEWSEHFVGQPELERYMNHVVDKFDLRQHMRFGTRVTEAVWDDEDAYWLVRSTDGWEVSAHHIVAATGTLSTPYLPAVDGRDAFRGEAYHPGLWPKEPVDVTGKRVAVIGTGSSGVQIVPAIADDVESLTVYQRTPNWCTPLNNGPVTPDEQADLKANFESIRHTLETSASGFLHEPSTRSSTDDPDKPTRWAYYEEVWRKPGFAKISGNYSDMMLDVSVNNEWCEFIADQIRSIVSDRVTAEKLIPRDHAYAGKRPPYVTGYFEAFNRANVELVSLVEHPIVCVTETGIETTDGRREFDVIIWATGFDYASGALNKMRIVGRDGLTLQDHWADGPLTYLGIQAHHFPNFFFPGGPHGTAGNNPRYNGDQSDWVLATQLFAREHGHDVVEVTKEAEAEWCDLMEQAAQRSPFKKSSYFFGGNIPGKPESILLNPAGRLKMLELMDADRNNGWASQQLAGTTDRSVANA